LCQERTFRAYEKRGNAYGNPLCIEKNKSALTESEPVSKWVEDFQNISPVLLHYFRATITEMDGVKQQNASLVEESASASQSLREHVSPQLQSVSVSVSVFTLAKVSHPTATRHAIVSSPTAVKKEAPADTDGNWTTF
jgi:hypothetical protein